MQSLMQRTVFRQDLEKVLGVFAKSKCPDNDIHHLIGNHDLYNFTRSDPRLKALFRKSESGTYYYSFSPAHGWKFIVLDPFDISTIDPAHGSAEDAWELLKKHNQNDVRDDKGDWYKDLEGDAKRWVPPNGALSEQQLRWLEQELARSEDRGERVVLLTHLPLLPTYHGNPALLWNFDEVKRICDKSSSLVLVLSGHDHAGGYVVDQAGVHHVTLPSPLNCKEGDVAFATVDVGPLAFLLRGRGDVPTMELPYRVPREEAVRFRRIRDVPNPYPPAARHDPSDSA